jgi:ParB family chromosome partitioning protein
MAKLGMLKNIRERTGTRDSRSATLAVKDIPIGDICMKGNIRKDYTGIEELAASIRQHGLLQPITIYEEEDGYIVKTGHRRYMACKTLYRKEPDRFHSIRCIVSDANNVVAIQLVENIQRVDLSQLDLFNALSALREQGMTLKQIADAMGKTEGYIKSLFVGVNEINKDENLKDLIGDAGITIRDIAETNTIPGKQERLNLLEERRKGTLNRAEMRKKARELKGPKPETAKPCVQGGIVKPSKFYFRIKTFPDMRKIVIYQAESGGGEHLASLEEDLRAFFNARKDKYYLEKARPDARLG